MMLAFPWVLFKLLSFKWEACFCGRVWLGFGFIIVNANSISCWFHYLRFISMIWHMVIIFSLDGSLLKMILCKLYALGLYLRHGHVFISIWVNYLGYKTFVPEEGYPFINSNYFVFLFCNNQTYFFNVNFACEILCFLDFYAVFCHLWWWIW